MLTRSDTLHMSSTAVGAIASVYLVGEVVGALVFGRLSDALGRRKLFMVTFGIYLVGCGLTTAAAGSGPGWVAFLYATRFVSGMGRPGIRGRLPSGRPASQTAQRLRALTTRASGCCVTGVR